MSAQATLERPSIVGSMRRIAVNSLGLGMILVLAGACTSGPESTIEAPLEQNESGGVTGGEIIVSGDLSAGAAADDADGSSSPPSTIEPTAGTVAESPPTTTRSTSTTTRPTSQTTRPTASTVSGSNSGGSSTVTTEAEVVGDGPVLTNPVGIDNSGESPGIGTGLRPVFFALEATTTVTCADATPGTVRLRWEVIGAESVDVSVRVIGNIRSADEPPSGTIDLPLDCTAGSQYFVIAENPDGETIRSVSVGAS